MSLSLDVGIITSLVLLSQALSVQQLHTRGTISKTARCSRVSKYWSTDILVVADFLFKATQLHVVLRETSSWGSCHPVQANTHPRSTTLDFTSHTCDDSPLALNVTSLSKATRCTTFGLPKDGVCLSVEFRIRHGLDAGGKLIYTCVPHRTFWLAIVYALPTLIQFRPICH
jgi:hypothetical protein